MRSTAAAATPRKRCRILDKDEVRQWFAAGRTPSWMVEEYARRYRMTISQGAFVTFQRRHIATRPALRLNLVPSTLERKHYGKPEVALLRIEERRRAGVQLTPDEEVRVRAWIGRMAMAGVIVAYEPRTRAGFKYVPRRVGIDHDIIRFRSPTPARRRRAG